MPTISEPFAGNATADALDDFRRLLWSFHDAARRAEKIETLPAPYRALAACIVKLSGLRPHIIVGESEPDDFTDILKDLEHITLAVDPLILAFGEYVKSNTPCPIDMRLFTNQLRDALDGNATHEVESAGERCAEDFGQHEHFGRRLPAERV